MKWSVKSSRDEVNNPEHYQCPNNNSESIEVIDVIELWNLGFHLGNVIKYILRGGKKVLNNSSDEVEIIKAKIKDYKKAQWYLEREVKNLEAELLDITNAEEV